MAIFLTRSLRKALRLHMVPADRLLAAIVLGFTLHPSYVLLGQAIASTLEVGEQTKEVMLMVSKLINQQPLIPLIIFLAILPAICEELTYRGFIFGGLLRNKGVLRAILISAPLFGLSHSFLQQSIAATIMGCLLGIVAWRTGSVLCTMLIHAINNSLSISISWMSSNMGEVPRPIGRAISFQDGDWHYNPGYTTVCVVISFVMLAILWRRNDRIQKLADEETLA